MVGTTDASPTISLVIPVFGTERYLGGCLESILCQTYRDFEVLVIDDESPGDVLGTADAAVGSDARFRVIRHEVNSGVMQARFTGGLAASGQYLGFVDPDDTVDPWFLENLITAALIHDADLVQCAFVEQGATATVMNRGGESHELHGVEILHGFMTGQMNNCVWNKIVRTRIWRDATDHLEPFFDQFAGDLLCTLALALHSTRFAHVSTPAYHYVRHESSQTMNARAEVLTSNLSSLERVYDGACRLLVDRDDPPEYLEAFFDREFLDVVENLLLRISLCNLDVPPGLPKSTETEGLLGAVARVVVGRS